MNLSMLLKAKESGAEILLVYATIGENGRIFGQRVSKEVAGPTRLAEINSVVKYLGLPPIILLDAPDVALRDPVTQVPSRDPVPVLREHWNTSAMESRLASIAADFKPDAVVTLGLAQDAHSGHKSIRIVTESLFKSGRMGPKAIALYAIDEGWRVNGPGETGLDTLEFNSARRSRAFERSFADVIFEVELLHASQHVNHKRREPEVQRLHLISGRHLPLFAKLFGARHCRGAAVP